MSDAVNSALYAVYGQWGYAALSFGGDPSIW